MLQYDSWKRILVLLVIVMGAAYAMPNVIGERQLGQFLQGRPSILVLICKGFTSSPAG